MYYEFGAINQLKNIKKISSNLYIALAIPEYLQFLLRLIFKQQLKNYRNNTNEENEVISWLGCLGRL
jgi:hypothetical protein